MAPSYSSYSECLKDRKKNQRSPQKTGNKKTPQRQPLCPRGYCTALFQFDVYPSAYANGYAVQVCQGKKPDLEGLSRKDFEDRISTSSPRGKKKTQKLSGTSPRPLDRWFREKWVDVCSGDPPKPCGGPRHRQPHEYPYCRPSRRVSPQTPKTVQEHTGQELKDLCRQKRQIEQKSHTPHKSPRRARSPHRLSPKRVSPKKKNLRPEKRNHIQKKIKELV